jgi:predicted AAA+ superfamily ATPase
MAIWRPYKVTTPNQYATQIDPMVLNDLRGRSSDRELYQVCYAMDSPSVRERELRAIPPAASHLKTSRNCIITFNGEETTDIDGVTVEVIPAWKWLLGK